MRPISNVVDVTNYVLLERNQPLHAFDLAKLGGRGIVVRLAADGERITTLDGVDRELTADDLLICDAERAPQAIAGIMGGSTVGGPTTPRRDPARVGVLRADGDRARRRNASSSAASRARASSVASTPTRSRATRSARWSCSPRWPARGSHPSSEDVYPAPGRTAAHQRAHEPGQPRARYRARRRRGVGRAGAARYRARRRWRRRHAGRDRRRRSAPTSNARSTSSRRSRAASASTTSGGRCRRPRPGGSAHARCSASGARGRRARRVRVSEAITLSLVSPADLERAGAPVDRLVARLESAPRRGVGAADARPRRAAAGGGVQPVARPRTTSPCSNRATCSSRRRPARPAPGGARAPRGRDGRHGHAAGRSRTTGRSTSTTPSTRSTSSSMRSTWTGSTSTQPTSPGSGPAAARGSLVGGVEVGVVGEVAGAVRRRARARAPGRRVRCRARRVGRRRPRRDRQFRTRVALPTVDRSISRSRSPTRSRPTRSPRTLRDAVGEVLEDVRPFDVFQLGRARPGPPQHRVRAAVPRARPHPHRLRDRRSPPARDRRGGQGARRGAPRMR